MNLFLWSEYQIYLFFFTFIRVSSIFAFLPIFGDKAIPAIVKILFSLAFCFVCFPVLSANHYPIDFKKFESYWLFFLFIGTEVMTGALIGYVTRWIFDAVQFAGHFLSTSIGFSIATVLDPHSESQSIALSELQYVLVCLLFLAIDGHHMYLKAILDSFHIISPGAANFSNSSTKLIEYLILLTSEVIWMGLKLAAPIMIVSLIINVAFGLISRAVPQVNILSISFSANIIVGLFVCFIAEPGFLGMVRSSFDSFLPEIEKFLRLISG